MRRILRLVRCVPLALVLIPGLYAPGAQALTLNVGISDQKPDVYIAADGRPAGILGELLNRIAREEGWTIHTESCVWKECLAWLRAGKIDLLPDVFYTTQRARDLGFHHVPALHSWSQIYARPDSHLRSIEDLNGRSIATLASSLQQDYLHNTFTSLDIDAHIDPVNELEEGFRRVQALQDDAVVADHFFGHLAASRYGLVATPIMFQPTQIFFAAPKGQQADVLATIDRYLGTWQANPKSFYYQTLDNWRAPQAQAQPADRSTWLVGGLASLLILLLIASLRLKTQVGRERLRLQASERRQNAILDSIDAIVGIKDQEGRYLFANRKLEAFCNAAEGQLIGHRDADFITDADSLNSIHQSDQTVLNTQERQVTQQTLVRPGSTQARTLLTIKAPLREPDGKIDAICVVATDITDRILAEETAHRLTFYDALTDLPNRRTALEHLEQMMTRARQGHAMGALLMVNLDGFKKINDMLGRDIGDHVLKGTASRLHQNTRERDLVSRVSADEFIVLLDGLGAVAGDAARKAMHVAEKLRLSIGTSAFSINDQPAFVTASIGLTLIHPDSQSIDAVMREADLATDRAKQHGGNQSAFFEQQLQAEVEQRQWIEHDLLQALNTSQLSMVLQPQFNQEGRVTGAELLARWDHPTRGAIAPAAFIPIAEESGLIRLLDEWSLNVAGATLLALQSLGETYPLSLNVSPKRLMEPQFTEYVRDMLEHTGVPGNRLIFEVTEGILIQDMGSVATRMQTLAQLGIRFSIDDFGTGYSNLASLKRLPLYELKIDQSLIQDVPSDTDASAIVQLILSMAEQLGLRVVAEGVEFEQQSRYLFDHGCHALQGYLLAHPMHIDAWLMRVNERRLAPEP